MFRPVPGQGAGQGAGQAICDPLAGGGYHKTMGGGYHTTPFHFAPSLFVFFELDRTARDAPAGRDWTGATPPF